MDTTHTPGPWHTAKREGGIAIEHREEKPYGWSQSEVALVYPLAMPEKGTGKANARLIAAAPELLSALEEMRALFGDHMQYDDEGYETAAILNAQAAIAKARGI